VSRASFAIGAAAGIGGFSRAGGATGAGAGFAMRGFGAGAVDGSSAAATFGARAFATAFVAGALFAGAAFAVRFVAGALAFVAVFVAGAAFAGGFFAGAAFTAPAFAAPVFAAPVFAGGFFAGAAFTAPAFAGGFFAGAAFTAAFFAALAFAGGFFAGTTFVAVFFTGAAFAGVFFVIAGPTVALARDPVGASFAVRTTIGDAPLYLRSMRLLLRFPLALVTLLPLFACGPNDPDLPTEPATCTAPSIRDFDAGAPVDGTPPRTLTIGAGEDLAFMPYTPGATAPVIMGFQGGAMITPTLRIPALPGDGASLCLRVELANRLSDGGEVFPGVMTDFTFTRVGDAFEAANIFDQLGFSTSDFVGKTLILDANVIGVTFRASASATLTLTN
jgi:hypothetical protein